MSVMMYMTYSMVFGLLSTTVLIAGASNSQLPLGYGRSGSVRDACSILQTLKPDQVLFPNTTGYEHAEAAYWTLQQTGLRPRCRFQPTSVFDIRDALNIAISTETQIAVVSGGHSSNTGASNVEGGLTIDLTLLSDVVLTQDRESVWLGPGARWSDVYAALETQELAVPGGRVGNIGVGGYILGGGFSWYTNEHGWSCDNVLEFEVITPNLEILQVNGTSHADLFWALKGSLGALGIVTSIRMKTLPNPSFFGGAISYPKESFNATLVALKEMAKNAEHEPATSAYFSFAYACGSDHFISNVYTINTANSSTSPAMGNFLMIPNKGHTLRHMAPRESADDIASSNPGGYRRSKFTFTILPTMEALNLIHDFIRGWAHDAELAEDELIGAIYQPLTEVHLSHQNDIFNGSLRPGYGPLMLVSVELWWKDAAKDATYEREFRGLYEDGLGFGLKWMLVLHGWLYPNYAAEWQEGVYQWRLGKEGMERLKAVKERYDPDDVWRGLVPGIWHV